ncbi:MAG: hypothetical protein AAGA16_19810 [Cyanobacteria bacterium P01_E01_bin.35]
MSKEIDDLLNVKIRSLSLDDKLFIAAEDWRMNACLNSYHDPTELYIAGYKDAADLLVESVAKREGTADSLIFPIVFLYRHYLELRLKSLLHDGNILLDRDYRQKSEHQLSKLWLRAREILAELFPNEEGIQLEAMDSLIEQFEKVDPRSTSFRYPKDFKGNNSVKQDLPKVNLRNLAEVVEGMSTILEGSALAISVYQENKNDMQSD